ncbi:MAG: hypothetical protein ACRYGK_13115, partial [Janthinobacterium lividum]
HCLLSPTSVAALCAFLGACTSLACLDISGFELDADGREKVAAVLRQLPIAPRLLVGQASPGPVNQTTSASLPVKA